MRRFEQVLDVRRPHTLLTLNPTGVGTLDYRYDDTGDTATVPNAWYNQPFWCRVEYLNHMASQTDAQAEKYQSHPPMRALPPHIQDVLSRFKERSQRIREEAKRMGAAADRAFPVAASRIRLDFGPNVEL